MDLHKIIDRWLVLESNKAKAFAAIRLPINHDSRIHDFPILTKKGLERLISCRTRQATDKNLLSAMMLKAGNSTLRINLRQHESGAS